MILWVDGAHDPVENMRRDASLLAAAERGAEPVLRLFAFAPPGITLGRSQNAERELDLDRCRRDCIPWARRPTGGRAIFHSEEWTYSMSAPLRHPVWGGSHAAAYRRVNQLLVVSLARLGVPARVAGAGRLAAHEPPRVPSGPARPCFASVTRDEVLLEGRKLLGSAQRRTAGALLQQGSLLLGPGHLRLADYLRLSEDQREPVRAELARSTSHAGPWLATSPALEVWADALAAALGSGVRRLEGQEGLFLLTVEKPHSYTAAFSQTEQ